MRKAEVFVNNRLAGILEEKEEGGYRFSYTKEYLEETSAPAVSLTLPKREEAYQSGYLFPFFTNMLAEGSNKEVQCRLHKIDKNDLFGLLLATADTDTIGNVLIKKVTT
jgi:HipA-like protein